MEGFAQIVQSEQKRWFNEFNHKKGEKCQIFNKNIENIGENHMKNVDNWTVDNFIRNRL